MSMSDDVEDVEPLPAQLSGDKSFNPSIPETQQFLVPILRLSSASQLPNVDGVVLCQVSEAATFSAALSEVGTIGGCFYNYIANIWVHFLARVSQEFLIEMHTLTRCNQ